MYAVGPAVSPLARPARPASELRPFLRPPSAASGAACTLLGARRLRRHTSSIHTYLSAVASCVPAPKARATRTVHAYPRQRPAAPQRGPAQLGGCCCCSSRQAPPRHAALRSTDCKMCLSYGYCARAASGFTACWRARLRHAVSNTAAERRRSHATCSGYNHSPACRAAFLISPTLQAC